MVWHPFRTVPPSNKHITPSENSSSHQKQLTCGKSIVTSYIISSRQISLPRGQTPLGIWGKRGFGMVWPLRFFLPAAFWVPSKSRSTTWEPNVGHASVWDQKCQGFVKKNMGIFRCPRKKYKKVVIFEGSSKENIQKSSKLAQELN